MVSVPKESSAMHMDSPCSIYLYITPEAQNSRDLDEPLWKLLSLLELPHFLQPYVSDLVTTSDGILASDGTQLSLIQVDAQNQPSVKARHLIPEGILFFHPLHAMTRIAVVTRRFQYQEIAFDQTVPLLEYPLTSFFASVSDFAVLDATAIPTARSGVVLLTRTVTEHRHSTVDMMRQLQGACSLSHILPCVEWVPSVVLQDQAVLPLLREAWREVRARQAVDHVRLQAVHVLAAKRLHLGDNWVLDEEDPEPVDTLLLCRRRLLEAAMEAQDDPGARWVRQVLWTEPQQQLRAMEEARDESACSRCPCCNELTFLHWGHQEWCVLKYVDAYCPLSFRPTVVENTWLTCPCCKVKYCKGETCVYCGLHLIRTVCGKPGHFVLTRDRLNRERRTASLTGWNVLSCVCYKQNNTIDLKEPCYRACCCGPDEHAPHSPQQPSPSSPSCSSVEASSSQPSRPWVWVRVWIWLPWVWVHVWVWTHVWVWFPSVALLQTPAPSRAAVPRSTHRLRHAQTRSRRTPAPRRRPPRTAPHTRPPPPSDPPPHDHDHPRHHIHAPAATPRRPC